MSTHLGYIYKIMSNKLNIALLEVELIRKKGYNCLVTKFYEAKDIE